MQLSQLFLECTQHTQPGVALWISHPPLEYTHHALPPLLQLWLLTYPWRMLIMHALLPAVATWLSHRSLEYAHHAQPGVAMWLSDPSLEYAHLFASAYCGYVAISLIPGVRTPRPARCGYVTISPIHGVRPPSPPLCQLWLRGYLTYPWSTHTTPSQVWPCGYISPIPGVRLPRPPLYPCQLWPCGYLTYPWSTHTTPSQVWLCGYLTHPWSTPTSLHLPAVATWLSHLSRDHAHHAHPSTSCGYVVSLQSPEYAHHTQPGVPISPIPGVRPPRPPSASCAYVAISLIPGACPPRLPFYPLWLCGFATNPWSTSNAPSHLPGVATRLSHLLHDFSPGPGIHPPRPASRRCGCYVAFSLFISWDSAASYPSTGVRPSHTALPPAVVAVPHSPTLS